MLNTMLNVADIAPVAAAATQQASASADLSVEIKEQIECVVLFRIPVPFIAGGIPVYESTVVTWIIMAVFIFIAILLTRNLKIVPTTKRQAALEVCVSWLRNFCRDNIGAESDRYMPYIGTVLIYIGAANIAGDLLLFLLDFDLDLDLVEVSPEEIFPRLRSEETRLNSSHSV